MISSCAFNGDWQVAQVIARGTARARPGPCEDAAGYRFLDDGGLCLAVGDGVGGGCRGDVCSRAAVFHALALADRSPVSPRAVEAALLAADEAVGTALERAGCVAGSGATMLAAVWEHAGGAAISTHVGDARIYRLGCDLRGTLELRRATLDHTVANLPDAKAREGRNPDAPCRMIGAGAAGAADIGIHGPTRLTGPLGWLLCTDGLHRTLGDDYIETVLGGMCQPAEGRQRPTAKALLRCARLLAREAQRRGGRDDIAILLAMRCAIDGVRDSSYSEPKEE